MRRWRERPNAEHPRMSGHMNMTSTLLSVCNEV